jgi:hypothetical protein
MLWCSCKGLCLLSISIVALDAIGAYCDLWLLWQDVRVLWQQLHLLMFSRCSDPTLTRNSINNVACLTRCCLSQLCTWHASGRILQVRLSRLDALLL